MLFVGLGLAWHWKGSSETRNRRASGSKGKQGDVSLTLEEG